MKKSNFQFQKKLPLLTLYRVLTFSVHTVEIVIRYYSQCSIHEQKRLLQFQ